MRNVNLPPTIPSFLRRKKEEKKRARVIKIPRFDVGRKKKRIRKRVDTSRKEGTSVPQQMENCIIGQSQEP